MISKTNRARQVNASPLEIDEFLKRHGIEPVNIRTVQQLIQEANNLTKGKRRNICETPMYKWEKRYGKWAYQIGPLGCTTALTEDQGNRLFNIVCQLDILLNGFNYDPEDITVSIPCTISGTCRYCSPF